MNQVILYLTNKTDKCTIKQFKRLKKQLKECDLIYLYHCTNNQIPDEIKNLNYYTFTSDILTDLNYNPIENTLIPGSNHFPLLKFYLEHPNYDYYWLIEDDVRYTGNFNDFINSYNNIDSDLLSAYVRTYYDEPDWYWWFRDNINYSINELLASFNPIYRISNKALCFLNKFLIKGFKGHHEMLMPSALKNNSFKVNDFNDFKPTYNKITYYHKKLNKIQYIKNMLYHPIKSKIK